MQIATGPYMVGVHRDDMERYGARTWKDAVLTLREASFHDGKPDLYGMHPVKGGKPDTSRPFLDTLEAARRRRDRLLEGFYLPEGTLGIYRQKIIFEHVE